MSKSKPPLDSEEVGTLDDFVAKETAFRQEAMEIMPYEFDECSYDVGYVRQSVWACRGEYIRMGAVSKEKSLPLLAYGISTSVLDRIWVDCNGKGVCYACSISCHSQHNLVELFERRTFRCDCPASSQSLPSSSQSTAPSSSCLSSSSRLPISTPCTLRKPTTSTGILEPNTQNKYGKNFKGEFCRCERGKKYDPETEDDDMIACTGCQDWFHERCVVSGWLSFPSHYRSCEMLVRKALLTR